ncbi:MAG TPA: T9SS type A sorting domain-containing protein [Bacteroidia bacterium]|nr:T9SS type A sorting domain-containing protein [Bacteroidia bacterium]
MTDGLGRVVWNKDVAVSGNSISTLSLPDLGNLQTGFYLIRVASGEKEFVRKVVRSR